MDRSTTGIKIIIYFLVFILQSVSIIGQSHYIDNYPGIPIIAHTNRLASAITPGNLQRMKELGVMGFYATDLSPATYSTITDSGLKVFPYQIWTTGNNWVVYYTDAIYTKWEAEGKGDGVDGDMELYHNSSICSTFTEGSVNGIKTSSSNAGNLTFVPYYYQYVEYKQLPIDPEYPQILYTADFELKIVNTIPIQNLPTGYENISVCTLKVVATNPTLAAEQQEHTIESRELFVRDFLPPNGNGWNQWKTISIANYDLTTLVNLSEQQLKGIYYNGSGNNTNPTYDSRWMQYKIDWAGVDFLDLYVDNIIISDQKGERLQSDTVVANLIRGLVNDYKDASKVLGWFGLNEPFSIDNYEPFRVVDSIINATSNGQLRLHAGFTSGWKGTYGHLGIGAHKLFGFEEFWLRAKPKNLQLNLYNYQRRLLTSTE